MGSSLVPRGLRGASTLKARDTPTGAALHRRGRRSDRCTLDSAGRVSDRPVGVRSKVVFGHRRCREALPVEELGWRGHLQPRAGWPTMLEAAGFVEIVIGEAVDTFGRAGGEGNARAYEVNWYACRARRSP